MTISPRLELRNIGARVGPMALFSDASFSLSPGECVLLSGANGVGKTTLLDIIGGVSRPPTGSVLLDGKDLGKAPPWRRARLGMARLFQDGNTFAGLTVSEVLSLPAMTLGRSSDQWRGVDVLKQLGVDVAPSRLCSSLSIGQRRLLAVAALIAAEPRVILLDEPAAGLSESAKLCLAKMLRKCCANTDCAILVVEHDLKFVNLLDARFLLLAEGKVQPA